MPIYQREMMEKSAVAEHVWENHHPIHWEETTGPAHPDDTLREALDKNLDKLPLDEMSLDELGINRLRRCLSLS